MEAQTKAILCRIPAFRPVVLKLLRVLSDEESSVAQVTDLLNVDPGLSAEILAEANSAMYGTAHRVSTTARAITMLGTERTKALATKAALDSMTRSIGSHPAIANCWSHGRATGIVAEWLAPFFHLQPDRAYTAGLIHDIGRLGLLSLDTATYIELLNTSGPSDDDVLARERRVLKVDHCQAGGGLTSAWGLPDELHRAAAMHHLARGKSSDPGVNLIRLACSVAQVFGYKAAPLVEPPSLETLLEEVPQLTPDSPKIAALAARLQDEVGAVSARPPEPIGVPSFTPPLPAIARLKL